MNIPVRGRPLGFVAVALITALLLFLGFELVDRYRKGNQRLIVEIQESLGASSLLQCMENISARRDPAYFPLLNRFPLIEYLNSNPPTLTPQQEVEGVPFQVFIDRYQAIWALTHESEARKAPTVQQFSFGADHLVLMNPEFEGMNMLLIPTSIVPLPLEERVKWAARSLECIEGYLGGGLLIDETTRIALISHWIEKCRFLLLHRISADHLRQLLDALDGVEPPVEAFRRAMRMTYAHSMELLQAFRNGSQGGSTPIYREPALNYLLSHLKTRIIDIDQPVEPMDPPWYATSPGGPIFLWGQSDDFINDTLALSHELEDGIEFFRQAVEYQIARLEAGDQAIAPQGITVKSTPSGQIHLISNRKPVMDRPTLPGLFEPYHFPK